jgi:hypothetical protein
LARPHAPYDEIFKTRAGASLVIELALRCGHINRIEKDGDNGWVRLRVVAEVAVGARNDNAQQSVARLSARAETKGGCRVFVRQAMIDEPASPDERKNERGA